SASVSAGFSWDAVRVAAAALVWITALLPRRKILLP
ncbi:hypothetical protein CP8484711_0579B, partial [Chlamydia psittaci 84-8471/1]